jgi:PGAP1-like protein
MAEIKDRVIQPAFEKGTASYQSITSSPSDSFAVCYMVPDRVIPVIFVPGVMGSNLGTIPAPGEVSEPIWLMNSELGMGWEWGMKKAPKRKELLRPEVTQVYRDGEIPKGTIQKDTELQRRGWGEIGFGSYAEALVWLENNLNDFSDPKDGRRVALINAVLEGAIKAEKITRDEIALTYKYQFPVHAVGYNWLDSNSNSAQRLANKIKEFIAFYKKNKLKCEQVIIVTHSMGGLVARHCSENLGMQQSILGVVHGVMPAIGAAAVYRRMKAGTENPGGSMTGGAASEVLGGDAAEMTTVLSSAPGPLQLLPSIEYGMQWLKFNDGTKDLPELSLPKIDPYSEIYTVRGKWWSLCDDWLIDAREKPKQKTQVTLDRDWKSFTKLVAEKVKPFLETDIKGKYHPNTFAFIGVDNAHSAYGQVKWRFTGGINNAKPTVANLPNAPFVRGDNGEGTEHPSAKVQVQGGRGGIVVVDRDMPMVVSVGEEAGDGTVPSRSGRVVKDHAKSYFELARVGHEPAYKNKNPHAQLAALHGIVKIAQSIKDIAGMAYK